ncbi:sentrin-specific protease 7 isoform X2 [Dunckerocampus dactyliophorus]|uniref:sentrin-specific protease 7 isoform X2 n=1 Tax=Dunckerocampus dactyliophorus TaxID=161453 RepID=UPI0024054A8C|nr:sentrin-specific protease 7 isoform X2 [Dunckerocampus dactyliophorus]
MMDHRKALTFPFTIDRDKLVSWAAIPGCKLKQSDLKLKRGSKSFDHNHAALVKWGMARGQPRLVLTDVLKTDLGKVYLSTQQGRTCGSKAQTTSVRSSCKKQPTSCQGQRPTKNDESKTPTAKCDQKSTSTPRKRGRPRKTLLHVDNKEESKGVAEGVLGNENGEDYRVVDCGLSLSWNPAQDAGNEFSPTPVKDMGTEERNKVQHCQRKRKSAWVNGTSTPKRHRESVLRLTGEDGRNGGLPQPHICPSQDREETDSLDGSIVQFTVGAVDGTPCLLPVIRPNLESRSRGFRRSSSQDSTSQSSQGEPIVLSSDDEESSEMEEAGGRVRSSSQEAASKELDDSNLQNVEVLPVVVDGPETVASMPRIDTSFLGVAFCSMFCGGYQGKANGNLMIANQKIIIPLKDANHHAEVTVTLERKEMRRYSVWESEELAARDLSWGSNIGTVLLFCVTQSAAAAVQRELLNLCAKRDEASSTDKVSPFIVLSLKDPVMGMEGALLRSLLEIDCLNCLTTIDTSIDALDLKDYISPSLSLDECLELIKRSARDPHLLRRLGVDTTESTSDTGRQSPCLDLDTSSQLQPEVDTLTETAPDAESVLELNTFDLQLFKELNMASMEEEEMDPGMQHSPGEEHTQHDGQQPNKEDKEEDIPLYTLCQRRTKGSYTVTMCKPDSSWVKYKHQGLGKRLVLFPPPPLKGGITVTMEDLQCLDSRQYLNDVIIDFYLKYLLHKSPQAIAERSHIFSSFFYKQLTRRDNASEGSATESCQRQKRHQRVKTWTRHVDIFKKDFVFVPVNQEAHWYLVVICFPGLEEPTLEARTGSSHNGTSEPPEQDEAGGSQRSSTDATVTPSVLNRSDIVDTGQESANVIPSQVNCTEKTCLRTMVCKRPCILVMDSLKLSLHERIFKVLREYLQSEWEVRRGSSRDFGPDQMKSSHCQVPLQDNSSDCGLYLLQYVESFLKDPVVHFDLPLHLQRWFPRHHVRGKRDEIRNLVLRLYRQQSLSKK